MGPYRHHTKKNPDRFEDLQSDKVVILYLYVHTIYIIAEYFHELLRSNCELSSGSKNGFPDTVTIIFPDCYFIDSSRNSSETFKKAELNNFNYIYKQPYNETRV